MTNWFWQRPRSCKSEIASVRVRAGGPSDERPAPDRECREAARNALIDRTGARGPAGDIDNRQCVAEPKAFADRGSGRRRQADADRIAGDDDATVKPSARGVPSGGEKTARTSAKRALMRLASPRIAVCSWVSTGAMPRAGDYRRDADKAAGAENDIRAESGQRSPRGQHTEGNARCIGEILNER